MTATTATLTLALSDLRRLAGTLIAAEIARRAVAIREAEKIAATVADECRRTRELIDAFRQGQEAELAAVLAETAELAKVPSGENDETLARRDALVAANKAAPPTPAPALTESGKKAQTKASRPEGEPITSASETPTHLTLPAVTPAMEAEVKELLRPDDANVLTAFEPPVEPDPAFDTVAEEQRHWEQMTVGRQLGKQSSPPVEKPMTPDEERKAVVGRPTYDGAIPPHDGWTADEDVVIGLLGVPAVNGKAAAPEVPASQTTPAGKKRNRKGR